MDSTVTEATIAGTFNDGGASVVITPPDSNVIDGHQVTLSAGQNTVTITVTAEDTTTTKAYTVSINRGVTDDYGWNAGQDLDGLIAAENGEPAGIWGNGATFWVSDVEDDKLYAYNADGTRHATQDFNTLAAAQNTNPAGHLVQRGHHVGGRPHGRQDIRLPDGRQATGQRKGLHQPGHRERRPQ